jgi:hypothetical protein
VFHRSDIEDDALAKNDPLDETGGHLPGPGGDIPPVLLRTIGTLAGLGESEEPGCAGRAADRGMGVVWFSLNGLASPCFLHG